MMNIPKVGDTISISVEEFTGDVTVSYVDTASLYIHHSYPIQCEVSEKDQHKLDESFHGQTMIRVSLKDIVTKSKVEAPASPVAVADNSQLNLFDFEM